MFPDEIDEYLDAVLTVDLCIAIAKKYKEPVDEKIRSCSLVLSKRIHHTKTRNLFVNLAREPLAEVFWIMMRRKLEEVKAEFPIPVVTSRA